MTLRLEVYRSLGRYLAGKAVGAHAPASISGALAPLRLVRGAPPEAPPGWVRVRPRLSGICGSDLGVLTGGTSAYFSALASMPFVPGHEVVGELEEDAGEIRRGERVVLDPLLPCAVRGVEPACRPCRAGEPQACERVATAGHVAPGLQTGYCRDTGGGWSERFVAHPAQLHRLPETTRDADALLVEPLACAIRAVRRGAVPEGATVLVVGAGTVGLLVIAALRALARPGRIVAVAKHAEQAVRARRFGASVVSPVAALGAVRRATGAFRLEPELGEPFLLGGAERVFECAGSSASIELALRAAAAGARVVLAAMPATLDPSPAWFRELEIVGSYSGAGAFPEAIELASALRAGELLTESYPLARWREALEHALDAGRLGAFKIAFRTREDLS
jgi:threonine dehydrogenase-like Zn-dependent dehydrogenase